MHKWMWTTMAVWGCGAPIVPVVPEVAPATVTVVHAEPPTAAAEAPTPHPWQPDKRYRRVVCSGGRPAQVAFARCGRSTEAGLTNLFASPELRGLDISEGYQQTHITAGGNVLLAERYPGASRIRELNLQGANVTDAEGLLAFENLSHLELNGSMSHTAFVALLGHKSIKRLHLDSVADLTDDDLSRVARLPALTSFFVPAMNRDQITSAGIRSLLGATKLEALDISGVAVSPDDLAALQKLKRLRHLKLGYDLQPSHLKKVAGMKSLRTLVVGSPGLSGLEHLQQLPELRSLLWQGPVGLGEKQDMAGVAAIPTLRHLSVAGHSIDDAGVAEIGRCVGLESLAIRLYEPASLAPLAALADLRELYVGGGKLSDDAVGVIAGMSRLVDLTLDDVEVPADLLTQLSALTGLRHLELRGVTLPDGTDMTPLSSLEKLERLEWNSGELSDEQVTQLATLSHLRELIISSNGISANALSAWADHVKLRFLDVWNTHVSAADCEAFNAARDFDVCTGGKSD